MGFINKITWLLSAVLICLILQSCASPIRNISENYSLNNHAGVILLSLTASGECDYVYFTEIREINTKLTYSIGLQDFGRKRDWVKNKDECPSKKDNFYGKLVVIELPVGSYEIYQFEGLSKTVKIYAKNDLSVKFTVKANKVNYLGNMHYHIEKQQFYYDVTNQSGRDFTLFQKKYNQFTGENVTMNLLQTKKILN